MKIIYEAEKWKKNEKNKTRSDAMAITHYLPWADRWTARSQAKDS